MSTAGHSTQALGRSAMTAAALLLIALVAPWSPA